MASIMTNASALTALQSLNSTSKNLETTQSRISTGYRVADASDNAAYWSIATTMRSDFKAMSTVQDSLGLGASKVDTAYTGMNKAIETVNEIKVKLVAANGASAADKDKIDIEIKALQSQLKSYADSATFSGANWLSTDTSGHTAAGTFDDVKIVASFNRSASGAVSLGTIDVKVQDIKLYDAGQTDETDAGILDSTRNAAGARTAASAAALGTYAAGNTFTVSDLELTDGTDFANDQQVTQMLGVVEGALKDMTTAATNLGAAKSRIDLQKTFTTSLMDSVERGVGQLVDADMNKESTRLQALQVQQQLGIQALSIANGNSQSILSLFR
jgi:flagellin